MTHRATGLLPAWELPDKPTTRTSNVAEAMIHHEQRRSKLPKCAECTEPLETKRARSEGVCFICYPHLETA